MDCNENPENDNLHTMIHIKKLLHGSFFFSHDSQKKETYEQIKDLVDNYLRIYCNHTLIEDWIDMDPDRSQCIVYCEKCESSFTPKTKHTP